MKVIASSERIKVPTNVKVSVRSRIVTVKGKRGTLRRSFRHLALDIKATNRAVTVTKYFGVRKELAAVRTVCSHIENMIKGVQFGYEYKMQTLHAHFPINVIVPPDGSKVSIKNFLGERTTRVIPMLPGVKAIGSGGASDTLLIQGNNIEDVSKCGKLLLCFLIQVLLAALIQQSCAARHKDIRKFLDGIYVSNRGTIEEMK
ncbi:60S ribosomal protein L9 [Echinococcus granulosus]|uniref:Large ribosomal subunit protein uL6 n=1 Tax=Echinococcus granulosus TaxID=6210 RepID=W6UGL9_ECHGR|nr:60S ribosomal protein L9 [Echinococcus granulosus]EUB57277.1 60S ribosomal protein L9 [Echinococcus granulosus]